MKWLLMFVTSMFVFLVFDMLWLNVVAKSFYRRELGDLMTDQVNVLAAVIFYILFIIGLIYFVIYPAFLAQSLSMALWRGAFFGFICYATYDLTNLATLRNWPLLMTLVDLTWGTVLGALTSVLSFLAYRRFF